MRIAAFLAALLAAPASAAGLDTLRWEMRPLLLFAPAADDPALRRQQAALEAERAGVADRRLAVYVVTSDVTAAFGAPPPDVPADALRRRFGVPDGAFRVVLVGLDGGAKLAEDAPVPVERLFGLVDGMPMRREELRRRDGGS